MPFPFRTIAGSFYHAHLRRQSDRFLAAARNCRHVQRLVLRDLLQLNADSAFSREHRLDGTCSVAEFRRALSIADFERVRPYVERVRQGECRALLGSRNPLVMFGLSSGTTSDSKYVPITKRFIADYRRGWQIWGIRAFDDHLGMVDTNVFQVASDFDRFRTPAGIPCGSISGLIQQMQHPLVRKLYTLPCELLRISDSSAKYYIALRLGLADANVGLATTANPGTLVYLARLADALKESLIRDLYDGTASGLTDRKCRLSHQLSHRIRRRRKGRARALEQIVNRTGRLLPRDFWPRLRMLGVWTGGSARSFLPSLRELFGNVPIRDHGLSATEGRMTIPLQDETTGGVLEITSHYYEFIPEKYVDSKDPPTLEAHELQIDEDYYIVLTTASGLYRYDIQDVARCTGFVGTTPVLEFLHKGAHISSVAGEKLTEFQVATAVGECLQQLGVSLDCFTITPVWGNPPAYRLLIEEGSVPAVGVAEELAGAIDAALRRLNCEYAEKRDSGRLDGIKAVLLPRGTWQRFLTRRHRLSGGSLEQYKHPCLAPDLRFFENLVNDCAPSWKGFSPFHRRPQTAAEDGKMGSLANA